MLYSRLSESTELVLFSWEQHCCEHTSRAQLVLLHSGKSSEPPAFSARARGLELDDLQGPFQPR